MDQKPDTNAEKKAGIYKDKPAVANLGIMLFYQALADQGCKCVQINWIPEYKQSEEIGKLLDEFL